MLDSINAVVSTQLTNHLTQHHCPIVVSQQIHTGERGCPAVRIDPVVLQQLLDLRGPVGAGEFLGCSTCTVQRWALDLGLIHAGGPVFAYKNQPDGTVSKVYHRREVHSTDEEVHVTVATVLETYPEIGQEKVVAALKAKGISATH